MTTHVLWILIHCLALVVFVNRYLAGVFLRLARGNKWDKARDYYEPTTHGAERVLAERLPKLRRVVRGERPERS